MERYFQLWDEYQGSGTLNAQGEAPKIGLVNHLYLAETDAEAATIAQPAWDQYKWNLAAPRRLEAERRGLTQFLGSEANPRPSNLPDREAQTSGTATARRTGSAGLEEHAASGGSGFNVVAGSPDSVRGYMGRIPRNGRKLLRGRLPVGPPVRMRRPCAHWICLSRRSCPTTSRDVRRKLSGQSGARFAAAQRRFDTA